MELPSGRIIELSPQEEAAVAKQVIKDRIAYRMNRPMHIERSVIDAGGTAAGLAIGGALIAWVLGKSL